MAEDYIPAANADKIRDGINEDQRLLGAIRDALDAGDDELALELAWRLCNQHE